MTWRVLLVAVLIGGAGTGAYFGTREARGPEAVPAPTPVAALPGVTARPTVPVAPAAPVPSRAGLAAALHGPLADTRLGGRALIEVRDAATGAVLFRRGAVTPAAPASTAKLATAAAVLAVHEPTDRITTRVVAGGQAGTIVLVGGGDPTLTGGPGAPAYPGAARISDLARQLRGVPVRRIEVDGTLFTGPAVSPQWAPEDIPSDYAAPITAAMVDGGRDAPGDVIRSTEPDLAAGRALAGALGVHRASRATAPPGARVLASVESAPIATLVRQMLQASDNVIAECLARQVALARHRPASFAGAARAVRAVVRRAGVDIGPGMVDGSGLAAGDRLTPDTLTRLLVLIAAKRTGVLDMLPVAGWSGTLSDRGGPGAGVVRAKTGTLTSVSTLAGLVHDRDGRLLAFAVMADRVGRSEADTQAAEAALDRVAGTLARCGC